MKIWKNSLVKYMARKVTWIGVGSNWTTSHTFTSKLDIFKVLKATFALRQLDKQVEWCNLTFVKFYWR